MLTWVEVVILLTSIGCMVVSAIRHPEWRGGLLTLGFVFVAIALNEFEAFWEGLLPDSFEEPELIPIGIAFAAAVLMAILNKRSSVSGFRAVIRNRRFPLLVWGLLFVSIFPNIAQQRRFWAWIEPSVEFSHDVREAAQEATKTLGYVLLLNWSLLFLKDKRHLRHHRPSPHEYLLWCNPLVPIGRGSRRQAYRIGDTGFCAKFYLPPEDCMPGKMERSIRREIKWRRFSRFCNSSSQEVYIYGKMRHAMPDWVRACMPPVCERVFHHKYGWGVLETLYLNPDGSAVVCCRREIARQQDEQAKAFIYTKVRDLLNELIARAARFHEPGNFHVLNRPDGSLELKMIDFEPDSKTLIPIESYLACWRRMKLRRKAKRFLAQLRSKYGIKVDVETEIG